MNLSLKTKIIIISFLSAVIFSVIISYIVFLNIRHFLIEQRNNFIVLYSQRISQEIHHDFLISKIITDDIASENSIKNFLSQKNNSEKVINLLFSRKIKSIFYDFYIVNLDGSVVISTNDLNKEFYLDYTKTINYTINDGKISYYSVSPVLIENEIIGFVVGKIKSDFIIQRIQNDTFNLIMLVTQKGEIIASNKEKNIPSRLEFLSGYEDLASTITLIEGSSSIKLNGSNIAVSSILETPFLIVLEENLENVINQALTFSFFTGLKILLAIIIGTSFLYILILKELKPIFEMRKAASMISKGDYSVFLNEKKGSFEIKDLSKAFNLMADNIRQLKEKMEIKIEEQTKGLKNQKEKTERQKIAILNILQDIKLEKRNSDKLSKDLLKFKLAVDGASDHIIITDPEGIILYANEAVEKITGYSSKEVINTKAGSLWKYPMENQFYKNLWETIKVKKRVFSGELKNRRKNGEVYEALAIISPILDENNEILFFIGIERDITKAKEIDKAKSEFVSLASHQLRTPLSSINWYSEILETEEAGPLNKDQKKFIKEICIANQRMIELVNALLNVSRIEMGTLDISPQIINFKDISQSVIKELNPSINKKKLDFKIKYGKVPEVNADPKLIRIIFQNLLSNSIKYTPEKGNISLFVGIEENFLEYIMIKVSDTGYGIPEFQKDKIFTKLFRADNVKEKDTEGTGLGLYLVKAIVEGSQGKIWFESEENKGTTFYVLIPLSGIQKKEGTKELI